MKILPILMITTIFTSVCAGSLPADFKFKPADGDRRSSFISQFKDYQETKEEAVHKKLGQASLPVEAHDTIEANKEVQVDFIERCKQLIARMVACFSASK